MPTQLQRLQQDSAQLESFIKSLTQAGDTDRAAKIVMKKNFLDTKISEVAT